MNNVKEGLIEYIAEYEEDRKKINPIAICNFCDHFETRAGNVHCVFYKKTLKSVTDEVNQVYFLTLDICLESNGESIQ